MRNGIRRAKIGEFIENISSIEDMYELFKLLNYPENAIYDPSYIRDIENYDLKKEVKKNIEKIYSILSIEDKLNIYLIKTKNLNNALIRYVTKKFSSVYIHFLLIFTEDFNYLHFVFPNFERKDIGKLKLSITKLSIDTRNIYYTDVETISELYYQEGRTWRDIWLVWREAFNVERVTEEFFENYKETFFKIRNELINQNTTIKHAHQFTLLLLNRLMFIYFVAKKNWLPEKQFIQWLWKSYKTYNTINDDKFYSEWLTEIFFKAFNDKKKEIVNIPNEIKNLLGDIPFLNGGLFKENMELDNLPILISDRLIDLVISFYNKYNFTIKEDMPFENEVAVDPQMIGYVYESLANVAEEIYDRNDLGIFYTPRIEVDFMCRNSIVHYIKNNIENICIDHLYHFVFDSPEIPEDSLSYFSENKLWGNLENLLENISIIDPACGSGAFLVGMLNIIAELLKTIYKQKNITLSDFEVKNRIIARSLYGVDVMPWAIEAAELRLWLQLVIETELKKEDRRNHAILPNLNMNLRVGDSLVQEIGGLDIHIRNLKIPESVKEKLYELKNEKIAYINNELTAKYKDKQQIYNEERNILQAIIIDQQVSLQNRKKELSVKQTDLLDIEHDESKRESKLEEIESEINTLQVMYDTITEAENKPFIWDIDFIEIFGTKKGFDIVIGNPPYVRQEMISPPNKVKAEVTKENKKSYKDKLVNSVLKEFPVIKKIARRSDLYIYFYFHGLNLLNNNGTFCFITSNSWLDVLYGSSLQEFLCKYVPIHGIFDNPKRSFEHADINTVISFFGSPHEKSRKLSTIQEDFPELSNTAKFIMFKKPLEEVLSADNLIDIINIKVQAKNENLTGLVKNIVENNYYRVFPITQQDLLKDGWDYPEDFENNGFSLGTYGGNKWGGKFLRAPDIFYKILEKGKNKIIELGDITSKIQRNNLQNFKNIKRIKENYMINNNIPFLHSLKDIKGIKVNTHELKYSIKKTRKINQYLIPDIVSNRFVGSRMFYIEGGNFLIDDSFFIVVLKKQYNKQLVTLLLNSTLSLLFMEINGRKTYSIGVMYIYGPEVKRQLLMNPKNCKITKNAKINQVYNKISNREIYSIFEECGIRSNKPIKDQDPVPLPDRKELDDIIFDELGLTEEERKEVYWSLCELVKQRLDKAKSLKKR